MIYVPVPVSRIEILRPLPINIWDSKGNLLLRKGQAILSEHHREHLEAHGACATQPDYKAWVSSYDRLIYALLRDSAQCAFWRAAGRQLLDCLEALPVAQRAAFLLHHEDGATVEDLAQRLALPFEAAKSRLRYALQKLRGCMQAYLVGMEMWP